MNSTLTGTEDDGDNDVGNDTDGTLLNIFALLVVLLLAFAISVWLVSRRHKIPPERQAPVDRATEALVDVDVTEHLEEGGSGCCICMEDFKPKERLSRPPGCAHVFHRDCIVHWLQTGVTAAQQDRVARALTCPICARPLVYDASTEEDAAKCGSPEPPPEPESFDEENQEEGETPSHSPRSSGALLATAGAIS
ncbi:hypothetical protein CTAYLR_007084 [Chrysophaeum taylorii]|uniref:RING-type domain-containing protein n=1 Tax=Chrysophaeum taylorii TaxID=2483200 RepID=A0AAD7UK63_9STRA|nr:hypothetical protein CTAYLR_007084 [Chrysophaeum taylorii]